MLHALADPLFAMNQALQGVVDAQAEATHATHKFGSESAQARQANLNLASAALDAEAAARTLAASVKNGSVSIGDARKFLKQWVADGLLTKAQADSVSGSFDHLIGRAQTISGLHPHMTVTADTSQADQALSNLLVHIGQVISGFLHLGGVSGINAQGGVGSQAYGPGIPKPRSGGKSGGASSSDSGYYKPSTSDSGYYKPSGGSGGGGGHSLSSEASKAATALEQAAQDIQSRFSSIKQYYASQKATLTGFANLSNANQPLSPGMAVPFKPYLRAQARRMEQFAGLYQRLDHAGLNQTLLDQLANIGPDAIPSMQKLLQTGRAGIRQVDRLQGRITRAASRVAGESTQDKYGPKIAGLLQKLTELNSHNPKMVRELARLNSEIDSFRHEIRNAQHTSASRTS